MTAKKKLVIVCVNTRPHKKYVRTKKGYVVKADHGKCKTYHRNYAARRVRRMRIDEDSYIMRGNNYRKAYDLAWDIN